MRIKRKRQNHFARLSSSNQCEFRSLQSELNSLRSQFVRGNFPQRGFCTSWTRIWGRILGCEFLSSNFWGRILKVQSPRVKLSSQRGLSTILHRQKSELWVKISPCLGEKGFLSVGVQKITFGGAKITSFWWKTTSFGAKTSCFWCKILMLLAQKSHHLVQKPHRFGAKIGLDVVQWTCHCSRGERGLRQKARFLFPLAMQPWMTMHGHLICMQVLSHAFLQVDDP